MTYLEALQSELADCKARGKTARVAAIKAEIARAGGTVDAAPVETADAVPAVENAAAPRRKIK